MTCVCVGSSEGEFRYLVDLNKNKVKIHLQLAESMVLVI